MVKKQKANKTQVVRDYLNAHPGAMPSEIAAALVEQGIVISSGIVGKIKRKIDKTDAAKTTAAAETAAPLEKPADTLTRIRSRRLPKR